MIYIAYPSGQPVFAGLVHCTTGGAKSVAIRKLGVDWQKRGYRIMYKTDYNFWLVEKSMTPWQKRWRSIREWFRRRMTRYGETQVRQLFGVKIKRSFFGWSCSEDMYWKIRLG